MEEFQGEEWGEAAWYRFVSQLLITLDLISFLDATLEVALVRMVRGSGSIYSVVISLNCRNQEWDEGSRESSAARFV